VSGFLAAPGDVEALAAGALGLLGDAAAWTAASLAAREKARDFDIKKVVPQYEEFYAAVVGA